MLEVASRIGKPVSVHSRGRIREVYDVLSSYDLRVHMHWFEGTHEELEEGMDRDYYFSYGPPIVYSKKLANLAKGTRQDRLMLETDSPVRYAACFESRESSTSMIASVYFRAASLLGMGLPELEVRMLANASTFLGRSIVPRPPRSI